MTKEGHSLNKLLLSTRGQLFSGKVPVLVSLSLGEAEPEMRGWKATLGGKQCSGHWPSESCFLSWSPFHGLSFVSTGAKVSVFSSHLVIDIAVPT